MGEFVTWNAGLSMHWCTLRASPHTPESLWPLCMYILIAYKFPRLNQSRVPKQRNREVLRETKCTASHLRHYVSERRELACISHRMN